MLWYEFFVSPFHCAAYKIQVLANCILQQKLMECKLLKTQDTKSMAYILNVMKIIFNHSNQG